MFFARKREAGLGTSLLKLAFLLGGLVLRLALLLTFLVLEESDECRGNGHVGRDPDDGVLADPLVLDVLGLAVKVEHRGSSFGWGFHYSP